MLKVLRSWIHRKIYGCSEAEYQRQIISLEKRYDTTWVMRSQKKLQRHLFGLIPVYEEEKYQFDTWENILLTSSEEFQKHLFERIFERMKEVSVDAAQIMSPEIRKAIAAVAKTATADASQKLTSWYQQHCVPIIAKEEERARYTFLDKVSKDARAEFHKICNQHLQLLLNRVKKVVQADGTTAQGFGTPNALPDGTIFTFRDGNCKIYVVEQKPSRRTVSFIDFGNHILQMPYVIFLAIFCDSQYYMISVFFRNEPIKSPQDQLFSAALPDVYNNGRVCTPGPTLKGSDGMIVNDAINVFWSSPFQNPITHALRKTYTDMAAKDPRFKTPREWADASKNPGFLKTVQWVPSGYTLETACQEAVRIVRDDKKSKSKNTAKSTGVDALFPEATAIANAFMNTYMKAIVEYYPDWKPDYAGVELARSEMAAYTNDWAVQLDATSNKAVEAVTTELKIKNRIAKALNAEIKAIGDPKSLLKGDKIADEIATREILDPQAFRNFLNSPESSDTGTIIRIDNPKITQGR